ncbi:type II secretion system minor pseudopilin GspK [Parvularcula lutaonensis]|uniref:Type II secretion system protein K n=1 Tax=Parvularcula lutaonensis TaxID=491923 RepID=A0ABV7MGR1_9PROT|nr:type II secretion system minor pseudopilin GspK [Parvularcula lutaonensis]GGY52734.1 type II secretion system protein K [Parvularcula lutaonensis]
MSRGQRGTALLTVLLLTATLAVLAIGMTELMTRSLNRTIAAESRDQAFWAIAGLETAALKIIKEQGDAIDLPTAPLFQQPVIIPFEGGTATIRFSDASNCFNINDLVAPGEDGLVADEAAMERFADLVQSLGANRSAGQQLAARAADFVDFDTRPLPGGFEDYDYTRHSVPYRTPRGLLASVSELRAIAGFSRDVYALLAPRLCALPIDGVQMLNVNTLTPDDAPLLQGALGDALTRSAAEQVIAQKPETGWEDVGTFLNQPLLAGTELPNHAASMLTTTSELIAMEILLEVPSGRMRQESLIWRKAGVTRVIERSVGERLP